LSVNKLSFLFLYFWKSKCIKGKKFCLFNSLKSGDSVIIPSHSFKGCCFFSFVDDIFGFDNILFVFVFVFFLEQSKKKRLNPFKALLDESLGSSFVPESEFPLGETLDGLLLSGKISFILIYTRCFTLVITIIIGIRSIKFLSTWTSTVSCLVIIKINTIKPMNCLSFLLIRIPTH